MVFIVQEEKDLSAVRILLLCAASAVCFGLVSPTVHWHLLSWILLIPFLEALEGKDPRRGFLIGWLCGTLVHLICFYWLIGTVHRYGNMNMPLSVAAWVVFSMYSGLSFGCVALAYRYVLVRLDLPGLVVFPACYTAMEFLFPFVFPWHLGAVLYQVIPLIQISDVFGIYGVTTLVVLVNSALLELARFFQKRRSFPTVPLVLVSLLILATWGYGTLRIRSLDVLRSKAGHYKVGLVQPDIEINERTTPRMQEEIWNRYRSLSEQVAAGGAQLIVWPESAVVFGYSRQAPSQAPSGVLREIVKSLGKPLLFGSWSMGPSGPLNTAYLLDSHGESAGQYNKVRLVAFGEYLPLSSWFPKMKDRVWGGDNFVPGSSLEPLCYEDVCVGVLICYEAVLDALSRTLVDRGAQFLVNMTNDVWFGDTICPAQHLMLASFRAVENRVWMVRVANGGISGCVDALGRISQRTRLFEQAGRVCDIELLDVTSVYRRWGDWFAWLSSLWVLLLVAAGFLRRSPHSAHPRHVSYF